MSRRTWGRSAGLPGHQTVFWYVEHANLFLEEVAKLDVACSQLEERNCNDLATEVCKTIVTGLTQKVTIF